MSRSFVFLLAAATLLLANCDNGGGSAPPVRLYFGMANSDACNTVDVSFDLHLSGGEVERTAIGALDCALDSALAADGCEASFTLVEDDTLLLFRLTGCNVYESVLFSCGFRGVSRNTLGIAVSGDCTCAYEPVCLLNGPHTC